ncbi:hypothetical protein ACFSKN_04765 [Mariniflexile gromovii]|uniref:Uncharacterized protein n=1 Tax=Mariniflexile gromovii TaxID=362523 RepID=A0ABS4BXQ6_9FLAO|nr:hypothetical protein [Mariniflexile gromovii]MBP0904840.1 hypothetical protein [Mariniflexile gromovii]
MAITFSKEINGIYPAFNDSYINFTSSLSNTISAEIEVEPFSFPFKIFPDLDGNYQFNLKELAKVNINQNGFEDTNEIPIGYFQILNDRIIQLPINITVSSSTESESISKNYEFIKSVKQVGEPLFSNDTQILSKSNNGIDYSLTHFEGFPFFFEIQKVDADEVINIKNKSTGDDVSFTASTSGTSRIWIDKTNENTTSSNLLPLTDTVNKLTIYNNGAFKTNLILKKVPSKCGVYLKWFNNDGGYNFYLFDEYYKETIKSKSIGEVTRNEFKNVNETPNSFSYSIGKEVTKDLRLKANVSNDEIFYIKDMLASPSIQLYTSQTPFVTGQWITVNVEGTIDEKTKKNINEVIINIELPIQYTMTY